MPVNKNGGARTPLIKKDAPRSRGWTRYFRGRNKWTLIYSLCLLIAAVGNSVFFKKMTNVMPNYPYYLSVMTTVVYVPVFFGAVMYETYCTDMITPEMRQFPKSKFFYMGAFDAVAGLFMLFGGVHTSGSSQALLTNAVIPVTMALAYFFLGTKFSKFQYIGATTIMLGVAIVLAPQFLASSGPVSAATNIPIFNLIFLLSVIPSAVSSVYKEMAFHTTEMDVNYLQSWVALWQVVFCLLMMPANTLSFLGSNTLSFSELPHSLYNGFLCLCGINSVVPPNCYMEVQHSGLPPCDQCEGAWETVGAYMFFNCSFNVFIMLVIKYGSAALMYIVMTIRLPLVQFAFSLAFINNPPDPFSAWSLLGLVAILIGLVLYRWKSADADDQEEETAVPALGQMFSLPIHHRRRIGRTAQQIKKGFFDKLGFYNSPVTPHNRSRRGSPSTSPAIKDPGEVRRLAMRDRATRQMTMRRELDYGSNDRNV